MNWGTTISNGVFLAKGSAVEIVVEASEWPRGYSFFCPLTVSQHQHRNDRFVSIINYSGPMRDDAHIHVLFLLQKMQSGTGRGETPHLYKWFPSPLEIRAYHMYRICRRYSGPSDPSDFIIRSRTLPCGPNIPFPQKFPRISQSPMPQDKKA